MMDNCCASWNVLVFLTKHPSIEPDYHVWSKTSLPTTASSYKNTHMLWFTETEMVDDDLYLLHFYVLCLNFDKP